MSVTRLGLPERSLAGGLTHNHSTQDSSTDLSLNQASEFVWANLPKTPKTVEESLARISQVLLDTIQAYQADQWAEAQNKLEDTLTQTLSAFKTLNLNPGDGVKRSLTRLGQEASAQRHFKIYPDHVEIYVGQTLKGSWQLYCKEDADAAAALAKTLGCYVEWMDIEQLQLFSTRNTHRGVVKPTQRSKREAFLGRNENRRPRLTLVASQSH